MLNFRWFIKAFKYFSALSMTLKPNLTIKYFKSNVSLI